MSTITTFVENESPARQLGGVCFRKEVLLDFSATNVSAADVVQAVKIPQYALVTKVWTVVKTAEGATCTATVGDATANGWDAAVDLNAAAGTVTYSLEATDTHGAGIFYTAADTIDLTMGHDTDTAEFIVVVEYTVLERYGA